MVYPFVAHPEGFSTYEILVGLVSLSMAFVLTHAVFYLNTKLFTPNKYLIAGLPAPDSANSFAMPARRFVKMTYEQDDKHKVGKRTRETILYIIPVLVGLFMILDSWHCSGDWTDRNCWYV